MNDRPNRNAVFVSYSHVDKKWLQRLQVHLRPLERGGRLELWDDTRIEPGQQWQAEIDLALSSARVAVLMISADFLASDFIAENELPPLLEAHAAQGAAILPLILSPSLFDHTPELVRFQSVNPPSRPLNSLRKAEQEAVLVRLSQEILRLLGDKPAPNGAGSGGSKRSLSHATRTDSLKTPANEKPGGPTASPDESTAGEPSFAGTVKLEFCQRLGQQSSTQLAIVLEIPSSDQERFPAGDEPRGIWDWLDRRRRLTELTAALRRIGRDDLEEIFYHHP